MMRVFVWLLVLWPGIVAAQCALPGGGVAEAVQAGVNAQRQAAGLARLAVDAGLTRAAQGHACDMALNGLRGHTGSDGSAVDIRVRRAGFATCLTAENVAWGFADAGRAVALWMGSDGHRRNILEPGVTAMGVGVAQGPDGPHWVLVLARGC